jgi:transposase
LLLPYYPQLLQLNSTPDKPWIWALLELAPLPQRGAKLTVARLKALLIKYHIRRWTEEELQVILRTPLLPLSAGSAEAISEHALVLLPQLRLLYTQRKAVRDRMKALLEQMSLLGRNHPECREHHDLHILLSIPGLGCLIAANLFTEASDSLAQRDYAALRAHSGVAPVTKQSGKSKQVVMRRSCSQRLRDAVYHLARCSVLHDAHSKRHYTHLRAVGHKHGRALRGAADRLLSMLVAMLKAGKPYDATRRSNAAASAPAT